MPIFISVGRQYLEISNFLGRCLELLTALQKLWFQEEHQPVGRVATNSSCQSPNVKWLHIYITVAENNHLSIQNLFYSLNTNDVGNI